MKTEAMIPKVFPPGDFIREELDARGWTQSDLAEILDRPVQAVNEIIAGKKAITPETAAGLAAAFGTTAQLWLNLENAYRLSRLARDDEQVARRSRLYSLVPVKELIARGWIRASGDLTILEEQVCELLETQSIEQEPDLAAAARKSDNSEGLTASQIAWVCRARKLARQLQVKPFAARSFQAQASGLPRFSMEEQDLQQIPQVLARWGVRLVILEHLPRTYIDGATFWLDAKSPVVALSLRYDRVDYFWFTLMHELAHVYSGLPRNLQVDQNLVGPSASPREGKPRAEQEADRRACEWLIPGRHLEGFIRQTRPYYAKRAVCAFAARIGVHPGIVVGRLQHAGEIPFSHHRALLVKVRDRLVKGLNHVRKAAV